jgi:hypothetical protein
MNGRYEMKNWMYMRGRASVHRSESTMSYRTAMVDAFEDWPANSPVLNPIENLWVILKARVEEERPSNREELISVVTAAWDMLPMTIVNSVANSMPRRIQKLHDKEGERIVSETCEFRPTVISKNDRSTRSTFLHNFSPI